MEGQGNWAVVDGKFTVGRGRYGNHMLCDTCGRAVLDTQEVAADDLHAEAPAAEQDAQGMLL